MRLARLNLLLALPLVWPSAAYVWTADPVVPGEKGASISIMEVVRRLPRRVRAEDGTPGDMVNFLVVGSLPALEEALGAAGWVKVDRTAGEAVANAIWKTLERKAYLQMPMSKLMLFDRSQDFGYAKALPIEVVSTRHHFRLWETPWKSLDGQSVWAGAGTHDIGFERDRRNRKLTHKIDPEIDKEREFIANSLNETGRVSELSYQRPADPVREATTATGAPYRSDGRILIIHLKPAVTPSTE